MTPQKSVSIIVINDTIPKHICDNYTTFLISNLKIIGYYIAKVSLNECNLRAVLHEINFSNTEYDLTIILSNLSTGLIHQALSKLFVKNLNKNEFLENVLKKANMQFTKEEIWTLPHINIVEGKDYPMLHLQRLFLIDERFLESIFESVFKKYLIQYLRPVPLKKIADVHLNGNGSVLDNLKCDLVEYEVEVDKSSSNSVKLIYESDCLKQLVDFEEKLKHLVLINNSKPVIWDSVNCDESLHVKHALQAIETCFKKYGPENTFISYNGGKDCTVLLHLMLILLEKNYPSYSSKPICLYVQSDKPFPEQEEFVDICEQYYNLEVIRHQTDIKTALGRILRDKPNLQACLMGTRRTDPFSQNLSEFQVTDKSYPEVMRVSPLLNWCYFDIWDYLLFHKVPYCKLYDMGYTSLGNVENTQRNLALFYTDILTGEEKYLPAYKLLLEESERNGRSS